MILDLHSDILKIMKENIFKIATALLLAIEGILPIYGIFFTVSIYKNVPILAIEGAIFFVLAFFSYRNFHSRWVQWIAIVYSLIKGLGGFLGLGWVFALVLAILYIIGGKKKDLQPPVAQPQSINPSGVPTPTVPSQDTPVQPPTLTQS